jgi:hypothetical protein
VGRPALDYLILDVVANEVRSFAHIRGRLASSKSWQSAQLVPSLRRLVKQCLVEAYRVPGERGTLVAAGQGVWPSVKIDDLWFRITGRGRMVQGAQGSHSVFSEVLRRS